MSNIFVCCLFLSICSSSYVLGKPLKSREAENVGDGCSCKTYSCSCCADLFVPQISLNDTICLSFGYEPDTYGISLVLAIDGKALINETISAKNPPPICFPIPYIEDLVDGCVHFYDLSISDKKFHGCAQLELRMWWVYVVAEYNLGCFDSNNLSRHHAKILKLMSKSKSLNSTGKAHVIKSTSAPSKIIQ